MSLRYSIYKVQISLFTLTDSLFILAHSVSFVKNFFQVFSNFSEVFFAGCSCEQLHQVSTSVTICQALFSRFCKFLTDSLFLCAAHRRLAYISTQSPFCQALFFVFSHLFSTLILSVFDPQFSISFLLTLQPSAQDSSPCGSRNQIRHSQAFD